MFITKLIDSENLQMAAAGRILIVLIFIAVIFLIRLIVEIVSVSKRHKDNMRIVEEIEDLNGYLCEMADKNNKQSGIDDAIGNISIVANQFLNGDEKLHKTIALSERENSLTDLYIEKDSEGRKTKLANPGENFSADRDPGSKDMDQSKDSEPENQISGMSVCSGSKPNPDNVGICGHVFSEDEISRTIRE